MIEVMAEEQEPTEEASSDERAGRVEKGTQTKGTSRRRFVAGGAAIAPVIMTLGNRPAFGAECSFSFLISGNLSKPLPTRCGFTPGKWQSPTAPWSPSSKTYIPMDFGPNSTFSTFLGGMFGTAPDDKSYTADLMSNRAPDVSSVDPTLLDMLPPYNNDWFMWPIVGSLPSLPGHIVAAIANAEFFTKLGRSDLFGLGSDAFTMASYIKLKLDAGISAYYAAKNSGSSPIQAARIAKPNFEALKTELDNWNNARST